MLQPWPVGGGTSQLNTVVVEKRYSYNYNDRMLICIDVCFGLLSCTVTGNNYSISYNIDVRDATAVELSLGLICGDACVSCARTLVLPGVSETGLDAGFSNIGVLQATP